MSIGRITELDLLAKYIPEVGLFTQRVRAKQRLLRRIKLSYYA